MSGIVEALLRPARVGPLRRSMACSPTAGPEVTVRTTEKGSVVTAELPLAPPCSVLTTHAEPGPDWSTPSRW
jgi:hypothetical protein